MTFLQYVQPLTLTIAQVQPKIVTTEAAHVQKGIVDLIARNGICKLVMGAASDK